MSFFPSFNWLGGGQVKQAKCFTGVSEKPSLEEAVQELSATLGGRREADLGLVFASTSYASDLPRLIPLLKKKLSAKNWVGCAGSGVIGTSSDGSVRELESGPALSVTLFNLPGVIINAFSLDTDALPDLDGSPLAWQKWIGVDPSTCRGMMLLVDPSTKHVDDLLRGLDYAFSSTTVIGGFAGIHNASHGSLFFNEKISRGAIVCTFGGDWSLDAFVAQGCKPIGPIFSIEKVQKNILIELGHESRRDSPVGCLQTVLDDLSPSERNLASQALFLGVECRDLVVWGNEPRSTKDTFLIRSLLGVDPVNGALAVGEAVRPGQHVQFHLREADASRKEAAEQFTNAIQGTNENISFGLLLACLGRGRSLYGVNNGDVNIARQTIPNLPISGVFCNGEIGPLGECTYIHSYAACWGLLKYSPIKKSIS